MTDESSLWTATNIKTPHKNDILLGRGGSAIHNDANVRYRTMVREHKKAYQTYTRLQKTQLAESLVREWQVQNPPGRFLELDPKTSTWFCIGEKSARRKTSQLLREGAPKIRRQIKEESTSKKAMTQTPPDEDNETENTSPVVQSSPHKNTARRPSRTPTFKLAKEKLKAKASASSQEAPVNITPQRSMAPDTRPPFSPNPNASRMATPSPNCFASPPPTNREHWSVQPHRWQWSPYYGSTNNYHYYTPAPSAAATPLRPITPADANRGHQQSHSKPAMSPTKPSTVERKYSISKPFVTPKPASLQRMNSSSSAASSGFVTPKPAPVERKFSAASPESVLDFGIIELPISSWDTEVPDTNCDDSLSSLVDEANQMKPAVMAADDDLKLPSLDEDPAELSPLALDFRKDSHPTMLDTLQANFSFDSWDRMESMVESEDLGVSTIDILNELDEELEKELFLRPCHSL